MIIDTLLHRLLRMPYRLHTTLIEPSTPTKKVSTVLFLHGLGDSSEAWKEVAKHLSGNYRIVTVDLLGFGKSPKPTWAKYDVKRQARAVFLSYLRLRLQGKVVLVGHSLGALVAVEVAKRYPLIVRSLILCSPPFYKIVTTKRRVPDADSLLRELYRLVKRHPDQFVRISALAIKLGLVNKTVNVTPQNVAIYMNALEASIINQTSLEDATRLKMSTQIIYGRLDPVVVPANLRQLVKLNNHVTLSSVLASHEIKGPFTEAIAKAVRQSLEAE